MKWGLIHKTFNFLFDGGEDSGTVYKIKQNVNALKENQLLQQAQIQEHHKLMSHLNRESESHKHLESSVDI